jgi:hypothetical protein
MIDAEVIVTASAPAKTRWPTGLHPDEADAAAMRRRNFCQGKSGGSRPAILRNEMRSTLPMLGVFIGVAALIAKGRSAQSLSSVQQREQDAISAFRSGDPCQPPADRRLDNHLILNQD